MWPFMMNDEPEEHETVLFLVAAEVAPAAFAAQVQRLNV